MTRVNPVRNHPRSFGTEGGSPHTPTMHTRSGVLVLLFLLCLPMNAEAQDAEAPDPLRLAAYLALGFGGSIVANSPFGSSDANLEPSVGWGSRLEAPLHRHFSLGGSFEILTIEPEHGDRRWVFDLGLWLEGRYPIDLPDRRRLELYLGFPVGFTLAVLDDPNPAGGGETGWPGWNIGALVGARLTLDRHLGVMAELGWRLHQVFNEVADYGIDVQTNQFVFQAGALYLF